MKTVPIATVAPESLPRWVLTLACRHPTWELNICTCLLPTPLRTEPRWLRFSGDVEVTIDQTRRGMLTYRLKGRDAEAVADARIALQAELPRLWVELRASASSRTCCRAETAVAE
jgi:hypothetical protein